MHEPDEERLPIEQHEAADRFGKAALRAADEIGRALAEDRRAADRPEEGAAGPGGRAAGVEPVVVRRGGPHRSIDGLAALIDAALEEDGTPTEPRAGRDAATDDGEDGEPERGSPAQDGSARARADHPTGDPPRPDADARR